MHSGGNDSSGDVPTDQTCHAMASTHHISNNGNDDDDPIGGNENYGSTPASIGRDMQGSIRCKVEQVHTIPCVQATAIRIYCDRHVRLWANETIKTTEEREVDDCGKDVAARMAARVRISDPDRRLDRSHRQTGRRTTTQTTDHYHHAAPPPSNHTALHPLGVGHAGKCYHCD